jgi:hypothetical protein
VHNWLPQALAVTVSSSAFTDANRQMAMSAKKAALVPPVPMLSKEYKVRESHC